MQRFYTECLGLQTVETGDRFCVLESDEWSLSLVRVPDEIAVSIEIATPPRRRTQVPVKLGFTVAGLGALRARAPRFGGYVETSDTQWVFRGYERCDAIDPEGNVIQLITPAGSGHGHSFGAAAT
jgi:catechol 2,3-dioxygenase-like lactoylglutathione lyase family enzyme